MAVIAAIVASRAVIFGIILHMSNVSSSAKMQKAYKSVAEALASSNAEKERDRAVALYKKFAESRKDKIIAITQLVFFAIGAILLMFPFFTVLANNWLSGQIVDCL